MGKKGRRSGNEPAAKERPALQVRGNPLLEQLDSRNAREPQLRPTREQLAAAGDTVLSCVREYELTSMDKLPFWERVEELSRLGRGLKLAAEAWEVQCRIERGLPVSDDERRLAAIFAERMVRP